MISMARKFFNMGKPVAPATPASMLSTNDATVVPGRFILLSNSTGFRLGFLGSICDFLVNHASLSLWKRSNYKKAGILGENTLNRQYSDGGTHLFH